MKIPLISRLLERRYSLTDMDRDMDLLVAGRNTATGVSITEKTALESVAVFACVRILSETLASIPLPLYQRITPRSKRRAHEHPLYSLLHDAPNPEMSSFNFREALMSHLVLWGNAYAEIDWDMNKGRPRALWPLLPNKMRVRRGKGWDTTEKTTLGNAGDLYYYYRLPDGQEVILPAIKVLHIPGLGFDGLIGYSPIHMAREAIGLSLATEEFGARFFGNGAKPGGVLEHPGKLGLTAQDNLRKSWNEMHQGLSNQHRIAILEEGMKYQQIGIPPDDAQFLETRKFQRSEIASFFHIPPHMIGDLEHATFSNIEHQGIEFVVYTMRPWFVRWEQIISKKLLWPDERKDYFAEFLVEGLLRGDVESRYKAYSVGRQWGWLSANDVRELENMEPLPDKQGDIYYIPMNMQPAGMVDGVDEKEQKQLKDIRVMTPQDWKESYEEGTPHWAEGLDPSLFAQEFIKELKEQKIWGKLLEIGCGNGRDSIFFARAGLKVTAIDIAPGALKLAKENAKEADVDIDFQEGNAEELSFEDASFDAIFTLSVLHSTDMTRSIPETSRVLKAKGLMLIYIYGITESADGSKEITISVDDFIKLMEENKYEILDFYSEKQEQFDEAGEKHQILVALVRRI